jgi:hypothetical protein
MSGRCLACHRTTYNRRRVSRATFQKSKISRLLVLQFYHRSGKHSSGMLNEMKIADPAYAKIINELALE